MPTKLAILGSTGSVGVSTLKILKEFPDRLKVSTLAAGRNVELLAEQIRAFHPEAVSVLDVRAAEALRERLGDIGPSGAGSSSEVGSRAYGARDLRDLPIRTGPQGAAEMAAWPGADLVVSAFVGASGLAPTWAAIQAGHDVALANKEVLVMAGELVVAEARRRGVRILPVDSEHAAIQQCLAGHRREDVRRVLLTGSGGPFRTTPRERLREMTPAEALRHPNWDMGPKITIDSASLMNKGLEMIEARWLFDLPPDAIDVVIHPQSIVHSLVEFIDGALLAQLGVPDMRGPIAYALCGPERLPLSTVRLDLAAIGTLTFEPPDVEKFPALGLASRALREGGTSPAVLNAANEMAVAAFLEGKAGFTAIPETIARTLDAHVPRPLKDLDDAVAADAWGRAHAAKVIASLARG
jgi:1-deoxy-D-xylulose-5-phosphate reductoisomerase